MNKPFGCHQLIRKKQGEIKAYKNQLKSGTLTCRWTIRHTDRSKSESTWQSQKELEVLVPIRNLIIDTKLFIDSTLLQG